MNLARIFVIIALITSISLILVHQQVEIAKVSYQIQHQELSITQALDQRQGLLYNVASLESPQNLKQTLLLAEKSDFSCLNNKKTIILAKEKSVIPSPTELKNTNPFSNLLAFLSLSSEAEANQ